MKFISQNYSINLILKTKFFQKILKFYNKFFTELYYSDWLLTRSCIFITLSKLFYKDSKQIYSETEISNSYPKSIILLTIHKVLFPKARVNFCSHNSRIIENKNSSRCKEKRVSMKNVSEVAKVEHEIIT